MVVIIEPRPVWIIYVTRWHLPAGQIRWADIAHVLRDYIFSILSFKISENGDRLYN